MDHQKLQYYIKQMKQGDFSCYREFYAMTVPDIYRTILDIVKEKKTADSVVNQVYTDIYSTIGEGVNAQEFPIWARNKAVHYANIQVGNGQSAPYISQQSMGAGTNMNQQSMEAGTNMNQQSVEAGTNMNQQSMETGTNINQQYEPKKSFFKTGPGIAVIVISTIVMLGAGITAGIFVRKYADSRNKNTNSTETSNVTENTTTQVSSKDNEVNNAGDSETGATNTTDKTVSDKEAGTSTETSTSTTEAATEKAFEPYEVADSDWPKLIRGGVTKEDMEVILTYCWLEGNWHQNQYEEYYTDNNDCKCMICDVAFHDVFSNVDATTSDSDSNYTIYMIRDDYLNLISSFSDGAMPDHISDWGFESDGDYLKMSPFYVYDKDSLWSHGIITSATCYEDRIEADVTINLSDDEGSTTFECTAYFVKVNGDKYRLNKIVKNSEQVYGLHE